MRRLLGVALAALVALYAAIAFELFAQNRWAEAVPESVPVEELRHPEALLALAQARFASNRFRDQELALVKRALAALPSSYEPPYLLATFYAARLERPEMVRAAFDAAVGRYPANGRLQLSYGSWLLESRQTLAGWQIGTEPGGFRDPLPDAELHLKAAMELEPDLSWRAFSALARNRIETTRWPALVPDDPLARTNLLDALFQAGEVETVWEALSAGSLPSDDPIVLRRIVHWGLGGDRPEVALEAARAWQGQVDRSKGGGPELFEPARAVVRAQLALGDPAAAYESLMETLDRVESSSGVSHRASLEFLCSMGDEFLQQGLLATAEALYLEASARSPSYAPALLGLARILARSGDEEGAVARYEEALRLDPKSETAARELKSLLLRRSRR
jgi:tetratricopeptide (TPR) repeat protein